MYLLVVMGGGGGEAGIRKVRGEEEVREEQFFPSHLSEPFLFPSIHQAGLLDAFPSSILPRLGKDLR